MISKVIDAIEFHLTCNTRDRETVTLRPFVFFQIVKKVEPAEKGRLTLGALQWIFGRINPRRTLEVNQPNAIETLKEIFVTT